MIAVSSPKPSKDSFPCAVNQWRANTSWKAVFGKIIYLCPEKEANLSGEWIESEPFPRIETLMQVCARQPGWSALINADIVVLPKFKTVEGHLMLNKAKCATSRRWQFDGQNMNSIAIVDYGLDFFCATQDVWQNCLEELPGQLRIGHERWDNWLVNYMNANCLSGFYDITQSKCILHPKHEDRNRVHVIQPTGSPYFDGGGMPGLTLKV